MRIKICGKLGDAAGGAGRVELAAEFGHALGNRDDGSNRRHLFGPAHHHGKRNAKPRQHFGDVVVRVIEFEHALGVDVAGLLHDRVKQCLLVVEVNVERTLRNTGRASDLAHAGRVEALLKKHRHRAVEDLATLGAVVFGGSGRAGEFSLKGHDGISASAFGYRKHRRESSAAQ